jgi:hypothetical protein
VVVARLHTKLFEAVARDLDRQLRAQFVEESLRPEYLKDFQRQLHAMVGCIDTDVAVGGRMQRVKRLFKRLIRPYWQHQLGINRMMVDRLSQLHADLTRLGSAAEELQTDLREELARQVESLRAELARRPAPAAAPSPAPIAAGSKLLLGTVTVRRPGYVHVDPKAEGSAPLDRLPMEPGTAAEIVVANALELYPAAEVRARLLPHWASLLQPGGRLTIIADDLGAAADRFRDGQIDFAELAGVLFGDGPRPRRSAYTPELLRQYAEEAGLADVSVTDRRQRPEAGVYAFELAAVRPAG